MTEPFMNPPQHTIDSIRRYILSAGRKFTGRQFGTARALIHYRGLLESYCAAKRKIRAGKLNPGSAEAISAGCKCPQIDNGFGKGPGRFLPDGTPDFWISDQCSLHFVPPTRAPEVE